MESIKKGKYNFKKKTITYKEQDKEKVKEYLEKISKIPKNNIVYVDETGINKHIYREHRRAKKGQKVYGKVSGRKFESTGIVAGKCGFDVIEPLQYSGTCLLYTSPSPRDRTRSRMPSSA